jgi:hypothetical protein
MIQFIYIACNLKGKISIDAVVANSETDPQGEDVVRECH